MIKPAAKKLQLIPHQAVQLDQNPDQAIDFFVDSVLTVRNLLKKLK